MTSFAIRPAVPADIPHIARHRAEMFKDMGMLPEETYAPLVDATARFMDRALPAGEYLGWVAVPAADPGSIVGGAGVQRRMILPFPFDGPDGPAIATGRQAIVMNVYTEPAWRRRGVARRLMHVVLEWARSVSLESLVLHASDEGRGLYEQLGFTGSTEMRFRGILRPT